MRCGLVLVALFALPLVARADEADDALAKKLGGIVRDPRQSLQGRVEAAVMIGRIGPRAGAAAGDLIAVLDRLRGTEQEPLQEAVVEALGQLGAPAKAALPVFTRLAGRTIDLDLALKQSREAILNTSDSLEVDVLIRQLLSRDASTRVRATKALADLGPTARAAVTVLEVVLGDADGDVRRGAINALNRVQPNAKPTEGYVRALAVDLRDPDANYRLLAVRALGRLGAPAAPAVPEIDALRGDPDPDVRRAAVDALNRIPIPPLPGGMTVTNP
ncbi:HEAT repeat domain-containing protein [Gemmata sp. G18]|uniref:HEAT repeat domain-containing protein n=1 Tax=Gemmata palustris TaxID=2822762 RepID=A0ABS5C4M3_9BACT|nr:HEAT repeat domain-containing protein [Gemmata palustris]MBP3960889.1 HEAT repeat domain-containing protein [Gemmata palustris]